MLSQPSPPYASQPSTPLPDSRLPKPLSGCFLQVLWLMPFFLLSIQLHEVSVSVWGISFLDQGWNPGPLHWECGVLTTGPPRPSLVPFSSFRPQLTCRLPSEVSPMGPPIPHHHRRPAGLALASLTCDHSIYLFVHLFTLCLPLSQCKSHGRPVCLFITGIHRTQPSIQQKMNKVQKLQGGPLHGLSVKQNYPPCSTREEEGPSPETTH